MPPTRCTVPPKENVELLQEVEYIHVPEVRLLVRSQLCLVQALVKLFYIILSYGCVNRAWLVKKADDKWIDVHVSMPYLCSHSLVYQPQ